jgi:Arc/MetJ family transcription regulator
MRTTISVDDHLLARARERARRRGQTLGQLVEDALRRELGTPTETERPAVPVFRGGTGARSGVDLTSNRGLREALDEGAALDELR